MVSSFGQQFLQGIARNVIVFVAGIGDGEQGDFEREEAALFWHDGLFVQSGFTATL